MKVAMKYLSVLVILILLFTPANIALAASEVAFEVGDLVHLVGTYTTTSEGTGERFSGLYEDYIIAKIEYGANHPYALKPVDKDWIDGWASESDILHNYTDVIFKTFVHEIQIDSYFVYYDDAPRFVESLGA